MTSKQLQGNTSPDQSRYGNLTDGNGNEVTEVIYRDVLKQSTGLYAPDGSLYLTLTNASGGLIPIVGSSEGFYYYYLGF